MGEEIGYTDQISGTFLPISRLALGKFGFNEITTI